MIRSNGFLVGAFIATAALAGCGGGGSSPAAPVAQPPVVVATAGPTTAPAAIASGAAPFAATYTINNSVDQLDQLVNVAVARPGPVTFTVNATRDSPEPVGYAGYGQVGIGVNAAACGVAPSATIASATPAKVAPGSAAGSVSLTVTFGAPGTYCVDLGASSYTAPPSGLWTVSFSAQ